MKAWEVRVNVLSLTAVDLPTPQTGEHTIQVRYAGICGSDTPKLLHPNDFTLPDPWRPGHEIVGADADGQIFAIDPLLPCGGCPPCTTGDTHLCPTLRRIGWDEPGGFAEHVTAPTANLHVVPIGLDPLHAVLADPTAVAIHGIRCQSLEANTRLAVIGTGAVGLLTALYASTSGHAVTVVHREGTQPRPSARRAVSAPFGSPSQVLAHSFEVVVDAATGHDATPLELALQLVRDGGTIVVQNAYHPHVRLPTPLREIFRRSVRIVGSYSYCRRHQQPDFSVALALLSDHAEQVNGLVVDAGPLDDLPQHLGDRSRSHARYAMKVL